VLGALYACALILSPDEVRGLFLHFKKGKHLLRFPYAVLPALPAIGAWVGFEAYRLAAGARKPAPLWVIPLGLFAIWIPVHSSGITGTPFIIVDLAFWYGAWGLPYFFCFALRRCLVTGTSSTFLAWTWCAICALAVPQVIAMCPTNRLVWSMGVCSYYGVWIADTCLIQRVARLRREGRLVPTSNVRFQFSLRSLLIFVLALAAWLSGLVLLFRI
jgi:hypothetical protein